MVAQNTTMKSLKKPVNLDQLQEALTLVDVLGPEEIDRLTEWVDGERDDPDCEGEMLLDWTKSGPHI